MKKIFLILISFSLNLSFAETMSPYELADKLPSLIEGRIILYKDEYIYVRKAEKGASVFIFGHRLYRKNFEGSCDLSSSFIGEDRTSFLKVPFHLWHYMTGLPGTIWVLDGEQLRPVGQEAGEAIPIRSESIEKLKACREKMDQEELKTNSPTIVLKDSVGDELHFSHLSTKKKFSYYVQRDGDFDGFYPSSIEVRYPRKTRFIPKVVRTLSWFGRCNGSEEWPDTSVFGFPNLKKTMTTHFDAQKSSDLAGFLLPILPSKEIVGSFQPPLTRKSFEFVLSPLKGEGPDFPMNSKEYLDLKKERDDLHCQMVQEFILYQIEIAPNEIIDIKVEMDTHYGC